MFRLSAIAGSHASTAARLHQGMGLVVDYRDQGCSGTFDYTPEISPTVQAAVVAAGIVALAGAAAWCFGLWAVLPLMVGTWGVVVARTGRPWYLFQPLSLGSGTASILPVVRGRRHVARFRVVDSWLEVCRGKVTERVFLPNARVGLHGHTLSVASTMTGVRVEIVGGTGDEEALRMLVRDLEQVGRHRTGLSSDVPEALRQLTKPPSRAVEPR